MVNVMRSMNQNVERKGNQKIKIWSRGQKVMISMFKDLKSKVKNQEIRKIKFKVEKGIK